MISHWFNLFVILAAVYIFYQNLKSARMNPHVKLTTAKLAFVVFVLFVNMFACQSPEVVVESTPEEAFQNIQLKEAQSWFSSLPKTNVNGRGKGSFEKTPDWDQAFEISYKGKTMVLAPLLTTDSDVPKIKKNNDKAKQRPSQSDDPLGIALLSNVLIYKKNDKTIAEIVSMIPDESVYKPRKKGEVRSKFSGYITVRDMNDTFLKGYSLSNGKIQGDVWMGTPPKSANGRGVASWGVCDQIDWYTTACVNGTCYTSFDRTEDIYCWSSNGPSSSGEFYQITSGGGTVGSNGQGGFVAPSMLTVPGVDNPLADRLEIQCLSNNNTGNSTYSLTLYVDQSVNGSNSTFSPSDGLGHAFIGLSRTDQAGNVTRQVIGFYPINFGKGVESLFVPVESAIKDNSGSPYDISYTVPLTAGQFTTAVNTALNWTNNDYHAATYNCTNAVVDVFGSVGIGIPVSKSKILIPSHSGAPSQDAEAIFVYSPGRLGEKLRQMKADNPGFNVNTANNAPAPSNLGSCK